MAVRRSNVIILTIQNATEFFFGSWSNMSVIEGRSATQTNGYMQGVPITDDTALDAVAITFYTDATRTTTRGSTDMIGGRTLAQIVTVSHDASTDMFTVTVDAANGLTITADALIYFDLSIVQPDP